MSKTDCRKFSPNIFNKQKCASCFKHKEEHSAEALDSNRASRKVQRCGFLFVAPDWDFTNPLNRTKRWQRRWFVLYDDGELTYSVDDHPETVPHGVIDMSKVLEVADAEDVTGNSFSVALTAADRVTFIKGTCRDESRWWMDALDVYTTAMVKGRNKRNATFPGGRASTHCSATTREGSGAEPFQTPPVSRRRLMSCQSEPMRRPPPPASAPGALGTLGTPGAPTGASEEEAELKENRPPVTDPLPIPGGAPSADDKFPASSESPPTQDRSRTRRLTKLARQARQGRAKSTDTIAEILATSQNFLNEEQQPQRILNLAAPDLTSAGKQEDSPDLADYSSRREEKLKDIADSLTRPRPTRTLSFLQSIEQSKLQSAEEKPTRENDDDSPAVVPPTPPSGTTTDARHQVRGDPDGCGRDAPDGYNTHNDLRVHLPAEELLRIKKGWLMKRTEKQTWVKHWFVLRGSALTLYRDTAAEDNNITDGVIDLSRARRVEEWDVEKNYGFQITTRDDVRIQLSAMTSGIRGNWIQALRGAAHLSDTAQPLSLGERLERQLVGSARQPRYLTAERDTAIVAPSSGHKAATLSSDDESRPGSAASGGPASEDGSGEERGDGEECEESEESEEEDAMSDSPPPSLGSLSRKERARSRSSSSSRSAKRSRSSPPTSRRNTRDRFPLPEDMTASAHELSPPPPAPRVLELAPVPRSREDRKEEVDSEEEEEEESEEEDEPMEERDQEQEQQQQQQQQAERKHPPLQRQLPQRPPEPMPRQSQQQSQQQQQQQQQERQQQERQQQQGKQDELPRPRETPEPEERAGQQQQQQQPAATVAATATDDSPFKRSWRLNRESLRSSLRSEISPLSDRLDSRTGYSNGLDRSKLRSSLRTLPTDPGGGGGVGDPVVNRLRQRVCNLESERNDAEQRALRATADQSEWRARAASLDQQLSQLLPRLQRQERQLDEQGEQLQRLQQLERRYHQLLRQHDELAQAASGAAEDAQWRRHYERLEERCLREHAEWERRLREAERREADLRAAVDEHAETDRSVHQLTSQLRRAETQLRGLAEQLEEARERRQRDVDSLQQAASVRETEMRRLKDELEAQQSARDAAKQDKSEVYKLKDLVHELRSLLEDRSAELERQRREARAARQELTDVRRELATVQRRLEQGIEENENLTARVRELGERRGLASATSGAALSASRDRFSSRRQLQIARIASLSDLTAGVALDTDNLSRERLQEEYSSLLERFEKAVAEIRALKRQVRELQGQQDQAELESARLKQQLETTSEAQSAEATLMKERLQDLTAKLAVSEKQARQLKQKLAKGDARDRRRTSSLKGREAFSLPAELETKLTELERRVAAWDGRPGPAESVPTAGSGSQSSVASAASSATPATPTSRNPPSTPSVTAATPASGNPGTANAAESARARRSRSFEESTKASRLRRKSLDSATASDSLRAVLRVNALEQRVAAKTTNSTRSPSPPHRSPAPVRRVRARSAELRAASPDRSAEELRTRLRRLEKSVRQVREQLDGCIGELKASDMPELSSVCGRLSEAAAQLSGSPRPPPSDGVRTVVERVRQLLLRKAREQAQTQAQLKAARRWSAAERRRLAAERLAYQTVLLACLAEALKAAAEPEPHERRLRLQLLLETHRRVGTLRHRLDTGDGVENVSSGMVEAFSSLLAEHLGSLEQSAVQLRPLGASGAVAGTAVRTAASVSRRPPIVQQDRQLRRLHQSLLKQETEVTAAVTAFKADKLTRLAESLAAETLLGSQQQSAEDDDQLIEEEKVRDAWSMAQNTITEELVEAEMSTMMLKFVELYERDLDVDRQHCFLLVHAQQEVAERRYTVATDSLRTEMEEAVLSLSQRYEAALARLRAAPEPPPPPPADQSDRLLAELADVVAQKAIVDGYLSVISDEDEPGSDVPLEIIEEDPGGGRAVPLEAALQRDSALAVFFGEGAAAGDQAELQHLYRAALERCRGDLCDYGVALPAGESLDEFCKRTKETVASVRAECATQLQQERARHREQVRGLERELDSLRRSRLRPRSVDKTRRRVSDITGMVASAEIETEPLTDVRRELALSSSSVGLGGGSGGGGGNVSANVSGNPTSVSGNPASSAEQPCRQCEELKTRIETLSTEHTSELRALRKVQDAELEQLRREMTGEVNKVTTTYSREKEALASEVRLLRRRLESLEAEYESQLAGLRDQYEAAAATGAGGERRDDTLAEESIRRRYQAEIEQLRALCEKGLDTMENSHRRIIAELEEKHHRELRTLEAEKQQALAEETQATLAALDALRKAHETEVQREICKFKDEFIKKMQPGADVGVLQKEHVRAEMGDIKGEILSLSEKYSIKCLETASLEERVETQQRSLQEANQRVFQLDARNKQLRAQLSANISELAEGAGSRPSAGQQLALAESQLTKSREEAERLSQELQTTQKREAELTALCRQLSSYLRAERQLRTDEVSSLRARLEHVILTASRCTRRPESRVGGAAGSGGSSDSEEQPSRLRRGASLNPARIRELMRSPSCPRLTGSALSAAAITGRLSSPLSGMVASRKKVFESPTAERPESARQPQRT